MSPRLADMDETWSSINVIRDITKAQRKDEQQLRIKANEKKEESTEEENGKWEWKVVGRRGERKLVKITVLKSESATPSSVSGVV